MELEVVLVVAGWDRDSIGDYRDLDKGLLCIERVVQDNQNSDFLLFPGGFITDSTQLTDAMSDLIGACSGYDGMLMTGYDSARKTALNMNFCLIERGGIASSIRQAAITGSDPLDEIAARDNRRFQQRGVDVGVLCCGEIFHEGLRDITFRHSKPDLLFNCVHNGAGLRHGIVRSHLDENSGCAGFYTYHAKVLYQHHLKTLAGVDSDSHMLYDDLNIGTIHYTVDTSKKHWFRPPQKGYLKS